MRNISFILAVALISAGVVGGWITSTTTGGKVEYPLHHGNAAIGGSHYALPLLD